MTIQEQRWIRKRPPRGHRCEQHLPIVPEGDEDDLWICPVCRRRWNLGCKAKPPGELWIGAAFAESVSIKGPDGSTYWRPFRARFIGRLQS
jgi:hypothetical protein